MKKTSFNLIHHSPVVSTNILIKNTSIWLWLLLIPLALSAQQRDELPFLMGFADLETELHSQTLSIAPLGVKSSPFAYNLNVGVSLNFGTDFPGDVQVFASYDHQKVKLESLLDMRIQEDDFEVDGRAKINVGWQQLAIGGRWFVYNLGKVRPFIEYTFYVGRPTLEAEFDLRTTDESFEASYETVVRNAFDALTLRGGKKDFTLGAEYEINPHISCFINYTFRGIRLRLEANQLNALADGVADGLEELTDAGFDIEIDRDDVPDVDGQANVSGVLKSSFPSLGVRFYMY